jgi:hypothetical protein
MNRILTNLMRNRILQFVMLAMIHIFLVALQVTACKIIERLKPDLPVYSAVWNLQINAIVLGVLPLMVGLLLAKQFHMRILLVLVFDLILMYASLFYYVYRLNNILFRMG